MSVKFELALQTPTVIINVKPRGADGAIDNLKVEFKRYDIKEADAVRGKLREVSDNLTEKLKQLTESNIVIKEEDLEESIAFKNLVLEQIVDVKEWKWRENGKVIKTIPSLKEMEGYLASFLETAWNSAPYRKALTDGMIAALNNTTD